LGAPRSRKIAPFLWRQKEVLFFSLAIPSKSKQIVSISCLDMKILYFSSSGAIPSTFLLGQRIIQWLDTSKIAYEKVDVFLNRKARDDLESLHGKVQIPCVGFALYYLLLVISQ